MHSIDHSTWLGPSTLLNAIAVLARFVRIDKAPRGCVPTSCRPSSPADPAHGPGQRSLSRQNDTARGAELGLSLPVSSYIDAVRSGVDPTHLDSRHILQPESLIVLRQKAICR